MEVFNAFGPSLIDTAPPKVRGSVFVLEHLLAVAKVRPTTGQAWRKHDFLGAAISDAATLLRWAYAADAFVGVHDVESVDVAALTEFYRYTAIRLDPLKAAAEQLADLAKGPSSSRSRQRSPPS